MTHYIVAVILGEGQAYDEKIVEALLAPYDEADEMFRDGSRWDWWQVGGRWDGEIRGLDWNPKIITCNLCRGTGIRPGGLEQFGAEWVDATGGCNGCRGEGTTEAFGGSHYTSTERNVTTMAKVAADYRPVAFVRPTGEWIEKARMGWFGTEISDEDDTPADEKAVGFSIDWDQALELYTDHVVVAIDAHV